MISQEGGIPDLRIVQVLSDMPPVKTKKEMQSFLGIPKLPK